MAAVPYTTSANLPIGVGTLTPSTGNYTNNTYVLERHDVREGTEVIGRLNTNGGPNGAASFIEARTASGTLQLSTTNTADWMPERNDEYIRPVRGTNVTWFFTEFGLEETIRGWKTVTFSAREKV